jgi:predicted fused transcriptional regulator/phosphomethylpyrimidine kinase/predicted transcriptional regulator
MHPPDELMVERFLPSMRQLVSNILDAQGFSQSKISAMLGVTQASVSLYLRQDLNKAYASLASLSIAKEDADRYSSLLAEDVKRDPTYSVETLLNLWTRHLGKGLVCDAHRDQQPSLAQCDICVRMFGKWNRAEPEAIAEVTEAVRLIEAANEFASIMPEVSVNLAYIPGSSELPEDVIAVPGRIVKIRGRAKAMLPPAPGSSRHLAKVLLLVRRRRKDVRAALNLTYDRRMDAVLKRLKLQSIRIGAYGMSHGEDPTLEALRAELVRSRGNFDSVIDEGTKGIEPNVYLFGRKPIDVANLAIRASKLYEIG